MLDWLVYCGKGSLDSGLYAEWAGWVWSSSGAQEIALLDDLELLNMNLELCSILQQIFPANVT